MSDVRQSEPVKSVRALLEDPNLSVPKMTIMRNNTGPNGAQIYVRGTGHDNSTWNEKSGVGVYFDDVYFTRQIGSLLGFIEYERVEVLRGPQGTLYGRSATSGAAKFVVSRPTFDGAAAVEHCYQGQLQSELWAFEFRRLAGESA